MTRSHNGERRISGERYILSGSFSWDNKDQARHTAQHYRDRGMSARVVNRDGIACSRIDVYVKESDLLSRRQR